jgi:lysophospholipase L1-like esterase
VLLNRVATAGEIEHDARMQMHPTKITFIGDSITWKTDATSYVNRIRDRYRDGAVWVTNWAVSGSHIMDDYAENMHKQVDQAASDRADIVIVALGTNDTVTDDTLRAFYETQINTLKASNPNATIYAVGILPRTTPNDETLKRPLIAQACANTGVTYWDTYTTPWIDPATETSDGLHPNAAGAEKIATEILARLPA